MGGTGDPEDGPLPGDDAGTGTGLSGAEDDFGLAAGPLPPGTRLGDVMLVRLLARGGMGSVYEARQDSPARTVAVKVLAAAAGSAPAVKRFAVEADLLGRVAHPHIARIHSAGTAGTPAGPVAFLVMELVAGARSITDHATARRLGGRERVTLFAAACDGVAHAHRSGIVHRDLKPGNLLVDADGAPKVIDFGIARAADDPPATTTATEAGTLVGTLRYMSPEQLGLDAGPVDARSDVYALGLVLHELLVGELPYDLRGRTPLEAACIVGRLDRIDPRPLARRLRGLGLAAADALPLATIVATCLEQRPAERYQSAGDLRADLGRWLAGDAIRARAPTLVESLARLVRRHRAAAAAAGVAVAALVAAVVGVSAAWVEAEQRRREAERAQAAADLGRAEAMRNAAETRAELYRSTVLLAAEARDRDNVAEARRLLAEATALAPAVPGSPVELDCLAASLDESLARLALGDGTVTAVAWSPTGDLVVAGTAAGGLHAWRPRGGAAEPSPRFERHSAAIWSLAFSPDGTLLVSASADGTARVQAAADGAVLRSLADHAAPVYGADFSPDGRLLATSGRDGLTRLWSTASWKPRRTLAGHDGTVYSARFAPDGRSLLTASLDGTARIWDVADGTEWLAVGDRDGRLFQAVFAADGRSFAAAAEDGAVGVWDDAGLRLARLDHPQRVNAVVFLASDRLATACGDGILRVWDVGTGRELSRRRGHAAGLWSLSAAPGAARVATGSADGDVRIWDLGTPPAVLALGDRVQAVAWSPDGGSLAAAVGGDVRLCGPPSPRDVATLAAAARRVTGVAFSADGGLLAAACDDGRLCRWAMPARRPLDPLEPHRRRIYAVAFTPDGRRLATASEDRSARILEAASGAESLPPLKHPGRVFGAAFTPDGGRLATACEDGLVRLWSATDGRELAALAGHDAQANWVAVSPDGTRLASASSDGTARLWRLPDGQPLALLTGPAGQVWKVAFSPDGGRVAAVSADGAVHLWDAAGGRPVAVLRGHADQAWGIAFTPSGRGLASGSWDGTVRLWGEPAMATVGSLTGDE